MLVVRRCVDVGVVVVVAVVVVVVGGVVVVVVVVVLVVVVVVVVVVSLFVALRCFWCLVMYQTMWRTSSGAWQKYTGPPDPDSPFEFNA